MAAANITEEELPYATINEEFVSGYDFEIHGDKLDDYFLNVAHRGWATRKVFDSRCS